MDIDLSEGKGHYIATHFKVELSTTPISAVLDSGAATSVMTKRMMKKAGYTINKSSKLFITTVSGESIRSLGMVQNARIITQGVITLLNIEVIDDNEREKLILGNDFLSKVCAKINYQDEKVVLFPQTRQRIELPIEVYCDHGDETSEEEDSEGENDDNQEDTDSEVEYEDEELEEVKLQEF
jgi:gag-polyprotein putative aspartyl protease